MITLPRVVGVCVLLITGYVFVVVPRLGTPTTLAAQSPYPSEEAFVPEPPPAPPPGSSAPPRPVFPPVGRAFFGAFTIDGARDFAPLDRFAAAAGRRPQVMLVAQGWATDRFDRRPFDRVARRGMLPMIAWEPWDYRLEPAEEQLRGQQPAYRLSAIIEGRYDDYIRSWVNGVRSLGYPIAIRLAHEMNGFWYPWCEQANDNRPGDFVRAWRHVHDMFSAGGADNVVWVWSPNVSYTNSTPLAGLYPGDDYVDWVGLSGYYGTVGLERYRRFEKIFGPTLTELHAFTRKPIVLTEVGATDAEHRKAEWVRDFLKALPRHPEIIGFIWYEAVKETDWRISDSSAEQVFRAGVTGPYFQVAWSPHARARTWIGGPSKR